MVGLALGWTILYGFSLLLYSLYATYVLVDLSWGHPRVSSTQITLLAASVAAPYLLAVTENATQPVGGATVGLLLSGVCLTAAMQRYPVMTGFPKADYVARTRVVETLQEPLVVLDWDDHVLDINETAVELFDGATERMIGEPVRSVVDGLERIELPAGSTGTVALRTSNGRRRFQYSVSPVDETTTDDGDDFIRDSPLEYENRWCRSGERLDDRVDIVVGPKPDGPTWVDDRGTHEGDQQCPDDDCGHQRRRDERAEEDDHDEYGDQCTQRTFTSEVSNP